MSAAAPFLRPPSWVVLPRLLAAVAVGALVGGLDAGIVVLS